MDELYDCQKCHATFPAAQMKDTNFCWTCSRKSHMQDTFECTLCLRHQLGRYMKEPGLCWVCSRKRHLHGPAKAGPPTQAETRPLFLFSTSAARQYCMSRVEHHATIIGARKAALEWANELQRPIWIYRLAFAESILPVPLPPIIANPQAALPGYRAAMKGRP